MAKTKKSILGKRVAPGIFEVEISGKKDLIQGQKVLIYKPTSKTIVSSTGRIIGQKEKILGTGKVRIVDDKILVQTSRMRKHKILDIRNGLVKTSNGSYKFKSPKVVSPSFVIDKHVHIKPVEE